MGGRRSQGIRRPGDRDFISKERAKLGRDAFRRPEPHQKKAREKRFRAGHADSPMLETSSKEPASSPRQRKSTEELQALGDDEILEAINREAEELKKLHTKIEQHIDRIKKKYSMLKTEEGRKKFWSETYDIFAPLYDEYMERSGHYKAMWQVLEGRFGLIKPPILFIAAGTGKVAKYILEKKDEPKDLDILLNQYRIIANSYPSCPVFENMKLAEKIASSLKSHLPQQQDKVFINETTDYTVVINDVSEKMLEKARENLSEHPNVKYMNFNATKLPEELRGRFETVVISQLMHLPTLEDKMNIIKSAFQALKPGGILVVIEEVDFRVSKGLTSLIEVAARLNAVACPINSKSDLIALFTRFEDRDGNIKGFENMDAGSNWKVDPQPKHVMKSYFFRKPLLASHLSDAASRIFNSQVLQGERSPERNAQHMLRCAIAAAEYVSNYEDSGIADKEKLAKAAAIAGMLHDLVRRPCGDNGRKGGEIAADLLEYIAGTAPAQNEMPAEHQNDDYRSERGRLAEQYPEELRIISLFLRDQKYSAYVPLIAESIRANEGSTREICNELRAMRKRGEPDKALLTEAMMYAEQGAERFGSPAVIRRSKAVIGIRTGEAAQVGMNDSGNEPIARDLAGLGFDAMDSRLLAFVGESMAGIYSEKVPIDFPAGEPWAQLKGSREPETKIYRAILQYFRDLHGLDESGLFDLLQHVDFPLIRKFAKKIGRGIDNASEEEFDDPFVDDATKLVVGLAYSQSMDNELRSDSESLLKNIRDSDLRSIVAEADIQKLKERFIGIFDQQV